MELFSAFAKYAAVSDRRLGPPALRWCRRASGAASCGPGEFTGAGQARPGGACGAAGPAARPTDAAGAHASFGARGSAAPTTSGPDQLGDGGRKIPAGGART